MKVSSRRIYLDPSSALGVFPTAVVNLLPSVVANIPPSRPNEARFSPRPTGALLPGDLSAHVDLNPRGADRISRNDVFTSSYGCRNVAANVECSLRVGICNSEGRCEGGESDLERR